MRMKVWSNNSGPVQLFETMHNTITTDFCTEERHKKCVETGICQGEEPQCETDECRTAGMDYHKRVSISVDGSPKQIVAFRKKLDARIKKALAARLKACKEYILTVERVKK